MTEDIAIGTRIACYDCRGVITETTREEVEVRWWHKDAPGDAWLLHYELTDMRDCIMTERIVFLDTGVL